jgi:transcriptional regulator with XRE-family HTH domain
MACTEPNTASKSLVFTPVVQHTKRLASTILREQAGSMGDMALKDRIREARSGYKGTIDELAKKVGVSRSAIYQWLGGNSKNLKLENLFSFAEATGYSARWIATNKEPKIEAEPAEQIVLDLSFLTTVLEAVEKYLDEQDLDLQPEAKAKVIALLYETNREKGKVEGATVARYLRLVA